MVNEKAFFESLKRILKEPCKAAIEAGRNWGMMYHLPEELDIEVTVAHPLKTRAIADAKIKLDSIDASTLAHLLRADLRSMFHQKRSGNRKTFCAIDSGSLGSKL